ncbi:restriction endonuclease [Clostridium paridis]|uniref:Restriction endonuclease n=1 Tax=Clostridium paridis TaxID=2803863 RepID=A0A937K667_9CLOT|nr:restriction endonuclease [Clostridium paridis]MBL4933388.1 restriction endonuclease [Clostridium paridis]
MISNFLSLVYGFLLIIVTIKFLIFMDNILSLIKYIRGKEERLCRLKNKILTLKDIERLSDYEYTRYCLSYLQKTNYNNMQFKEKENKLIIGKDKEKNVLVYCNKSAVGRDEFLSFLGILVKSSVYTGVIVSPKDVNDDIYKLLKETKKRVSVDFINTEKLLNISFS